jgi:hypothetical protein
VPGAWRCFPWDPAAPPGAPFSPAFLVPGQTVNRFDLHDRPPVRYLAESPEHAIGETLAAFRGTEFLPSFLRQHGRPLALVEVTLAPSLVERVADCTDPAVLSALGIRPDELAHHDRTRTQAIARRIHGSGGSPAGLRWWSALTGAWHTTVLFTDRERPGEVRFGTPHAIEPGDARLARALSVLGVRVR